MWAGAYWIGLNDEAVPNSWVYSNGDDNSYTNWDSGNPFDFEPYNCGRINPYRKWESGRCDLTQEFFCMVKRKFCASEKTASMPANYYCKIEYLESTEECILDTKCEPSLTECSNFDECINTNGDLTVIDNGGSLTVSCVDPDAIPANNGGTSGVVTCVCDGKNDCSWESDDFVAEITEDGMCITDHVCPVR